MEPVARWSTLLSALLAVFALSGCGSEPAVIAPANPPTVTAYAVYPFGAPVEGEDHRVLMSMLDQLEPRFGRVDQGKLRIERRQVARDVDLKALRQYYVDAATERHLFPMQFRARPSSWALAFADGEHVLVIQALKPDVDQELAAVPLTIVTNLDANTLRSKR